MRYAFVMGSNGPESSVRLPQQLSYALNDVKKIRNCLENPRCGFEVHLPPDGADTFTVLKQLTEVAELCNKEDTFVCYFSGHGYLYERKFFLLWDKSIHSRLLSSALQISHVMDVLEGCKARNKLLILDCCNAGAAVGAKGSDVSIDELTEGKEPTNYQMLLASERVGTAFELKELEGSFLTTQICSALGEDFYDADKDRDGQLTVQELREWLEGKVVEYNSNLKSYTNSSQQHALSKNDITVPVPFLFGRGDFSLTSSDWEPQEIDWVDGSKMVVLPIKPMHGLAQCISKHPVTNAQYRKFIEEFGKEEPSGKDKDYVSGHWTKPLDPWKSSSFNNPDQPVVCVSYQDAKHYCDWVNHLIYKQELKQFLTKLPDPFLWDFSAFGVVYPSSEPELRLKQTRKVHDRSTAPAPIDLTGERWNARGISDMFGNVWEWCHDLEEDKRSQGVSVPRPELRGGSFLDNISLITTISLDSYSVQDRVNTRHSDLGFRIAAEIPVTSLPEEIQRKLSTCISHEKVAWLHIRDTAAPLPKIAIKDPAITLGSISVSGFHEEHFNNFSNIINISSHTDSDLLDITQLAHTLRVKVDNLHDSIAKELKEPLKKFQAFITETSELDEEDKIEVFKQIEIIIEAVQEPQNRRLHKAARTSIKVVKGTIAYLSKNSKLQLQLRELLPLLEKHLK